MRNRVHDFHPHVGKKAPRQVQSISGFHYKRDTIIRIKAVIVMLGFKHVRLATQGSNMGPVSDSLNFKLFYFLNYLS